MNARMPARLHAKCGQVTERYASGRCIPCGTAYNHDHFADGLPRRAGALRDFAVRVRAVRKFDWPTLLALGREAVAMPLGAERESAYDLYVAKVASWRWRGFDWAGYDGAWAG